MVVKFQFHKGTIRTHGVMRPGDDLALFQFHKGTIRTSQSRNQKDRIKNFNSIKVRLEP